MPRISFVKLLSVLVLTLGAWLASASAAITYEVGTCKPHFPTYSSISAALAATTPPDVVMICPGTYTEQIEITLPVTLEGVSVGDSAQVIIEPPSGGLITNTSDDFGVPVAAQVWVNNVTGPVNITDITLDATGNAGTNQEIIGVYYQNSSGTINRVATRNQQGNTLGTGIWVQGGAANPSVLIENSSIHDFDFAGIVAVTDAGSSQLTATVKGNNVKVSTTSSFTEGIVLRSGATTIVSNNFVSGETFGIASELGAAGSISGNTLIDNNQDGIVAGADAVPVTSNKILNAVNNGIVLRTSAALIQGNSILNTPFAINFDCQANANVHSNTISDAGTALAFLPPGLTTLSNSYFNVSTIRSTSLCGPDWFAKFGTSPSVAGDVNGDGYPDLIVGAWQYSGAAIGGGRAYLYSGKTGSLIKTFTCRIPGDTFGFEAVTMGDMDGTDGGNLDVVYFAEPPSPLLSCVKQLCRNRSDSPYGTEFTAPISVAF